MQRAIVLGMADPVGRAKTVVSLLGSLPMAELDSVTVQSLGHAASCIGDFELADSIYTEGVIRLRVEGRMRREGILAAEIIGVRSGSGHGLLQLPQRARAR